MILGPSLLAIGSWALVLVVAALTAAFGLLMPLRWGWKAFPFTVIGSLLTAAFLIFALGEVLYRSSGGFVVHFNVLHLTAACALGAIALWAIRKARRGRIEG